MSATVFRFKVGRAGASMAHMEYISRHTAVLDEQAGVLMRNIPESVKEARDYRELRENLASYAWARERSEIAQYKSKAKGEVRTHYRVMASFEKDFPTEKIKQMMNEWLENKVPSARACGFIHRDTDHTHIHIWVDARQISGEKLHFGSKSYKSLDKEWNRIYSKEIGRPEKDYLDRIDRNRQIKSLNRQLSNMLEYDNQPDIARPQAKTIHQQREERNLGANHLDQERTRRNQSKTPDLIKGSQERESNSTRTAKEQRVSRAREGERVQTRDKLSDRSSSLAGERDMQNRGASREAEDSLARGKELVRATDKEMERASREYEQALAKCQELEREHAQAIERRKIEQEQEREEQEEYEYEQDYEYDYDDRDDYDEPGR